MSISGAHVRLVDIDRDTALATVTNNSGLYTFHAVHPGRYRMEVQAKGFKVVNVTGLTVNTQANLEQNFSLSVGSVSESITVEAKANEISTSVSTVVDRQFVENMPLNGRSFQSLIELTPGVVVTPSTFYDSGQFSVNGQRGSANYWTVDGVSANIGVGSSAKPGNGMAGSLGSFSAAGGTNSLVSVDALQEFRIQTSTYAPEFGRTPGAQISIETRSGTNQFHGSLFDYLRNDALDANDWFARSAGLPKAKERQNDFGGTLGGPILKGKTFFFFSYEGLRLRLPQTALLFVPDAGARQNAIPAMRPFLNAFPLPNGRDDPLEGIAQFNTSFSNPASLDAYSIRVDHKLSEKLTLFGRYNYSPSEIVQRAPSGSAASQLFSNEINTQTLTIGSLWLFSPAASFDSRFNYSRTSSSSVSELDSFGGAIPLTSFPFPAPFNVQNAQLSFNIATLTNGIGFSVGKAAQNLQRQINIVDSVSWQKGSHTLKFGMDFRRLKPQTNPAQYIQGTNFFDVTSAETGDPFFSSILTFSNTSLAFHNLGVFGQDSWRVSPRLAVTYGLRWDVDFAPSTTDGPNFPAVTGFNLSNLSQLALAPPGTSPFSTRYGNVAPRIGAAYQTSQSQAWGTVIRGGFGVFYDLMSGEIGNELGSAAYPFGAFKPVIGPFPLTSAAAAPPAVTAPSSISPGAILVHDPNLQAPYTLEWNIAVEQALGKQQIVSASYVGAVGRRLLQTAVINSPNPTFSQATVVANEAVSNYHALQLQMQRRATHGLQILSSYAWAHSIDTASAGSAFGNPANTLTPSLGRNANRGSSDFDIRNAFSAGVIYDVPAPRTNAVFNAILRGWSLQSNIQARSAPPVNVFDGKFLFLSGAFTEVRPDIVPGRPLYLIGSKFPGGKALNPAAFKDPPTIPAGCDPLIDFPCEAAGQGNLGRNALRGFGATQWDFGVHRDIPLRESLKLEFRAEMFNVLNHPNFAQPSGAFGFGTFGVSSQMLNQGLGAASLGQGGFNPLYQIGGPRSIQFALKLQF